VRNRPLPYRNLFGETELEKVREVFENSWQNSADFGFQGKYEELYTKKFCEFQGGGGFADGVSSGTAAVYLALNALRLEDESDVLISPVTDPGGVMPVLILGMNPVIADSEPDSFNIGPDEFEKSLTPNTRAAILTHLGGHPVNIEPIIEIAKHKHIKIIEDCSQAHGALYKGKRIGAFGDIAAFSTMFSKNHATGGCGGLVYTQTEDYYWLIRSLADRGKPFRNPDFDPKNPSEFLFPALNFNLNELSCAIGLSTLSRLQEIIDKRYEIAKKIDDLLIEESSVVYPCQRKYDGYPSLFFHTVEVSVDKIKASKKEFADAVAAEGIWINPDYRYVVSEWKWIKKYLRHQADTPNAVDFRERTFNLLFNEQFTDEDIEDIIKSILKVETYYKI